MYYLLGVFGVVWFVCWVAFVYDTPDKHPFIHQGDLRKLKLGIGQETSHNVSLSIQFQGQSFTSGRDVSQTICKRIIENNSELILK